MPVPFRSVFGCHPGYAHADILKIVHGAAFGNWRLHRRVVSIADENAVFEISGMLSRVLDQPDMPELRKPDNTIGRMHVALPAVPALIALKQQISVIFRKTASEYHFIKSAGLRQLCQVHPFAQLPGFRRIDQVSPGFIMQWRIGIESVLVISNRQKLNAAEFPRWDTIQFFAGIEFVDERRRERQKTRTAGCFQIRQIFIDPFQLRVLIIERTRSYGCRCLLLHVHGATLAFPIAALAAPRTLVIVQCQCPLGNPPGIAAFVKFEFFRDQRVPEKVGHVVQHGFIILIVGATGAA